MRFPKLFSRYPEPPPPPPVCTRCGRPQDGTTPGCDPQPGALCYGLEALAEGEMHQPRCPGCRAWQAGYHHADCTWAKRHQP
jgi:hypothetical protein